MAELYTGTDVIVKVKEVDDRETTPTSGLETVVGTNVTLTVGMGDISTQEFGTGAAALWDDGVVTSRNWSGTIDINRKKVGDTGKDAQDELDGAAVPSGTAEKEVYIEIMPFGDVTGEVKYSGYVTVSFNGNFPRAQAMTASYNYTGRGPLTKAAIPA